MSEGNRENALIYIRSAESLDTFNADYKVKYANLLLSSEGLTKEDFETAKKLVSSAEKQANTAPKHYRMLPYYI